MMVVLDSEVTNVSECIKDDLSKITSVTKKSHSRKLMKEYLIQKLFNQRSLLNDQSYLQPFTNCFDGKCQYLHNLYVRHITDTSYNTIMFKW